MVIYNMYGMGVDGVLEKQTEGDRCGRQGRVTSITFVTNVTQHFCVIWHSHNLAFFVMGQCRRCRDLAKMLLKHDVTGSIY